jgi:hypothetical protein
MLCWPRLSSSTSPLFKVTSSRFAGSEILRFATSSPCSTGTVVSLFPLGENLIAMPIVVLSKCLYSFQSPYLSFAELQVVISEKQRPRCYQPLENDRDADRADICPSLFAISSSASSEAWSTTASTPKACIPPAGGTLKSCRAATLYTARTGRRFATSAESNL